MSFTRKLVLNWEGGDESVGVEVSDSEGNVNPLDTTVEASQTDQQHNWAVDVSKIRLLYMYSDQDVLIETNSPSAPDNTWTLKAGKPYIWIKDANHPACLITVDVVTIYFTTGAIPATANVKLRVLQDDAVA